MGSLLVTCFEKRLESLDVHVHLALVVDSSAGIEIAVALGGLEGRRLPLVEWIGRLDIVVSIAEAGRFARSACSQSA